MATLKTLRSFVATIGIECHVQLKTKTKLFAAIDNDARESPPNTLISHICLGMPGALPVLNAEAIHLAVKAGLALNSKPQHFSKFDRKHYFYPDLPKGYQITQFDQPIIIGGHVAVVVDGKPQTVRITRAHLEEDAGKSTHPVGKDYSLVDLNRAGTPLLEIVSEPDMHSAAEAKAFAKELYLLMRYADVSDANLFYGNMRFDVNVSLSQTRELGTRTETKNLNSFRSVEKAVEYEIKRQTDLLAKGESIVQETRGWDDAKQKTFSQRSKEDAHDYRYMPEPDVPPVELDENYIKSVEKEMPIMPDEWRKDLNKLGLNEGQIETLLMAELDSGIKFLNSLQSQINQPELAKFLANWYVNVLIPLLNDDKVKLTDRNHLNLELQIYKLLKANKLSSTAARALFVDIAKSGEIPDNLEAFAQKQGYIQVSNVDEIAAIVEKVLADNPKAAEDVKNGETKATQFLVGQVMSRSQGKANPQLAQELIRKSLQ